MEVMHEGLTLTVTIPKHMRSGDLMTIEAESPGRFHEEMPEEPPQDVLTEPMHIVVPEGVYEGQTFVVETAWGGLFDIECPAGCCPGSEVVVDLPSAPERTHDSPELPRPRTRLTSREAMGSPDAHESRGRGSGSSSSNKHHRHSRMRSPSGGGGGGGFEQSTPPSEPPLRGEEPADSGHRYRAGAKVQVLRSDGTTYSPGTVLGSYDGVFDVLYQVQLDDSGLIKQAVPEDEMFSSEDADDENFQLHFQHAMQAMMEAQMLDQAFGMECDYD